MCEPIPGESTLRELRAREPRPWRECASRNSGPGFAYCRARKRGAPLAPRRIARSAQHAKVVERVRSASSSTERCGRPVRSTRLPHPQAPGLPPDQPATDAEVGVGVAALLPGARSRHGFRLLPSVRRRAALGPQARASPIQAPSLPLAEHRSYLEVRTAAKARWLRLWTRTTAAACVEGPLSPAHSLGRPRARPRMGRTAHRQPSAGKERFLPHGSDGAGVM